MKFTAEWRDLTEKMGYFVDLDHPYITYDNKYIETLRWLLKQLYNKGLLYKGYTIQPYSPRCRYRFEFSRVEPAWLLPRCEGPHHHSTVPHQGS